MQNIVCSIGQCGFHGASGFCQKRVVKINDQGVCNWLTKPGWEQQIESKYKHGYKAREPVQTPAEIGTNKDQDQTESGKEQPPRD